MASPATPSPTASADGARRENKKRADDEKQSGAKKRKASSKISGADRRGSGGRDALGVLRGGNNASTNLSASRGKTRGVKPNAVSSSGNQKALVKKKLLRTPTQRAVGTAVETETFSSLSKSRRRAGARRRGCDAPCAKVGGAVRVRIRGSSLVMQVEQALGVGSGALRGHGSQIQSLARAKGRMPPRQRA